MLLVYHEENSRPELIEKLRRMLTSLLPHSPRLPTQRWCCPQWTRTSHSSHEYSGLRTCLKSDGNISSLEFPSSEMKTAVSADRLTRLDNPCGKNYLLEIVLWPPHAPQCTQPQKGLLSRGSVERRGFFLQCWSWKPGPCAYITQVLHPSL